MEEEEDLEVEDLEDKIERIEVNTEVDIIELERDIHKENTQKE